MKVSGQDPIVMKETILTGPKVRKVFSARNYKTGVTHLVTKIGSTDEN